MESELSVRDVLTKEYVAVSESDSVLGAVRLMRKERSGSVLVVRGDELVGIMTEWDVLRLVSEEGDPAETAVEEVMSTPVMTIEPDWSLTDAADVMARDNVRNLVVETDDGTVGVLTQRDVIAAAGSFHGTVAVLEDEEPPGPMADTAATPDAEVLTNGGDEYTQQGVCEGCGSLTDSLWEANGKLVCADCRSV